MVSRLLRNSGLPQVQRSRVTDPLVQRALDALYESLESVVNFLQPFAQPDAWKTLPYYSTWARLSATLQEPVYCKNPLGDVLVRGSVVAGVAPPTTIAVLPVGFRPPIDIDGHPASCFQGGSRQFVSVDVKEDGRIVYVAGPALAAGVEVHLNLRFSTRA